MTDYHVQMGDTIHLQPALMKTHAPPSVHMFLQQRGWTNINSRWENQDKKYYFMEWEQAVACEFYEFITLGGR